eukprot:3082267-Rhodomonas_salina.2
MWCVGGQVGVVTRAGKTKGEWFVKFEGEEEALFKVNPTTSPAPSPSLSLAHPPSPQPLRSSPVPSLSGSSPLLFSSLLSSPLHLHLLSSPFLLSPPYLSSLPLAPSPLIIVSGVRRRTGREGWWKGRGSEGGAWRCTREGAQSTFCAGLTSS